VGEAAAEPAGEATVQLPTLEPPPERVGGPAGGPPAQGQAAIDLGTTVLPALARAYWKQLAGVLLVLLVLRWWRRR
jgi:hypothetical protein